jgi:hypothetical protein
MNHDSVHITQASEKIGARRELLNLCTKLFVAFLLLISLAGVSRGQTSQAKVPAIRIDVNLLDRIEKLTRDIQAYTNSLDVEKIGVSYKDGKSVEQWRALVSQNTHLVLDTSSSLRQADSMVLAVILSQTLWSVQDNMNTLESQHELAGNNSTSASAVRAAIPFIEFKKRIPQLINNLDERVQAIATVADTAVRTCTPK